MELRRKAAVALAVAGMGMTVAGLVSSGNASAIAIATQQVSLHNDVADPGEDCPDSTNDYWHFVVNPNNATYHFVSMHLMIDGSGYDFTAWSSIIKNGSQEDNVFVKVPAGKTLADLDKDGSYAVLTPDTPAPTNFNLSHLCDGTPVDTTAVETTAVETTAVETTTGDTGGEGNSSTPTSDAGSGGGLPEAGADNSSLVMLGAFMTIGGLAMAAMSRRRSAVR